MSCIVKKVKIGQGHVISFARAQLTERRAYTKHQSDLTLRNVTSRDVVYIRIRRANIKTQTQIIHYAFYVWCFVVWSECLRALVVIDGETNNQLALARNIMFISMRGINCGLAWTNEQLLMVRARCSVWLQLVGVELIFGNVNKNDQSLNSNLNHIYCYSENIL